MVGTKDCQGPRLCSRNQRRIKACAAGRLDAVQVKHLLAGCQHPALAADVPAVWPVVLPELAPHLVQQILRHDDMRTWTL